MALSNPAPFLALAIYPASVLLGSFNPVEFWWSLNLARRGLPYGQPMPSLLKNEADAVGRYLSFAADLLILGFVTFLSRRLSISSARIGLHLINWKHDAVVGIAAGSAEIAVAGLVLRKVPIDPKHDFTYRVRSGSPLLWVLILTAASFAEELWIALCVRAIPYSPVVSITLIVLVFAAMHHRYRLWGAAAVAVKGTISALLFLHFGSLVVTFPYHLLGNLGSLYFNRYWRR